MTRIDGRQLARFASVVAVLAAGAAVAVVVALVPGRKRRRAWAQPAVALIARGVLRALGIEREQRGPTPRGDAAASGTGRRGALITANHLSWLDIVVAFATWRCTFVAKREVGTWPVIGTLARAMGAVFVDRSRKRDLLRAIPALEQALRDGECVMLFPEGTTTPGTQVLRFRSALMEAAVRAGAPIFPIAISAGLAERDTTERPPAVCWCDDESLATNVWRLAGARDLFVSLHVGAPIGAVGDRKARTQRAWHEVVRRFVPVQAGEHAVPDESMHSPLAWSVSASSSGAPIGSRA